MAHYNANSLCVHCKHIRPALDSNIQKAYLGKCMKREWPFTLAITLQGWTECDVFEESGQKYVPPDPMAAKAAVAAAAAKGPKRVEFYYSTAQKPGETFPCDNNRALELVKKLQASGVEAKAVDMAGVKDPFPIYHKSERPGCIGAPGVWLQGRSGSGLRDYGPGAAGVRGRPLSDDGVPPHRPEARDHSCGAGA